MKLKLLILLLFVLCMKNVAGTDKKKKQGGGRLKKLAGVSLLLLNGAFANHTTQTNAPVCPTTLPPYALDMMNYIRCGEKEETTDFYEKYLTARYEDNKVVKEPCWTIGSVYQKAKSLGKCAVHYRIVRHFDKRPTDPGYITRSLKKFTNIVSGAQQRILGKTPKRKTELKMFREYLNSEIEKFGGDFVTINKAFEKLDRPDFFRIKKATEVFKHYSFWTTDNWKQMKEALKPKYQTIDFDKADYVRQLLIEHKIEGWWIVEELLKPKNQNLNWDKVIRMVPYAKKLMPYAYDWEHLQEAVKPEYQKLDFDKVDRMMSYAKMMSVYSWEQNEDDVEPKWQKLDFDKIQSDEDFWIYLPHYEYEQIQEALNPKYQSIDFDKADYIYKLLLKNHPSTFFAATDALSEKYQNYDVVRVRKVFEGLELMIPNNFKFAAEQALKPWIQKESFSSEYVEEIFNDCKKTGYKNLCWKSTQELSNFLLDVNKEDYFINDPEYLKKDAKN